MKICTCDRVRRRWGRGLAVALFSALPTAMFAQSAVPQDNPAEARGLPSGFRLNSVSAWAGRNYLLVENTAGAPAESYLLGYGGGFDAGLYLPGKTGRASLDYSLNYNANTSYGELNGFDHRLFLSWTRTLNRSFSFSVTGMGESTTVQGFLFQQPVSAAPDLSNAGALAGSLVPSGAAGATQTVLYPARRQTAMLGATLTYAASARSSWNVNLYGQRLLPSNSYNSTTQQRSGYPGETDGGASLAFSYSVSRRTSVGAELGYFRGVSPLGTTQGLSGGLSLTRVLSRRWFTSALAGYGIGDYFIASSQTTARRIDFTGRATLGTTLGAHTISLSASQRIGDSYGFGAERTLEGSLAWIWHPKRRGWAFQATAGYERLTGIEVDKLQSAVFHGALTRRLAATLSCTAEGGYTWGIGQATVYSLGRQTQNGMRFSLVWRPAGTLW